MSVEASKHELIDAVPGIDRGPIRTEPSVDRKMPIAIEDFKGDPRRVIGHPSNPNAAAIQAYAEHSQSGEQTTQTETSIGRVGLSTEVSNSSNRAISKEELRKLREGL